MELLLFCVSPISGGLTVTLALTCPLKVASCMCLNAPPHFSLEIGDLSGLEIAMWIKAGLELRDSTTVVFRVRIKRCTKVLSSNLLFYLTQ